MTNAQATFICRVLTTLILTASCTYMAVDNMETALAASPPPPKKAQPKVQQDFTGKNTPTQLGDLDTATQRTIKKNVFLIGTPSAGGTGFLVDAGPFGKVVISVAHVCGAAGTQVVLRSNDTPTVTYAGKVRVVNLGADLCIIKTEPSLVRTRKGFQVNTTGEVTAGPVIIPGHPGTEKNHELHVLVTKVIEANSAEAITDAPFYPGNSGSPVLNQATGEVIGVASAYVFGKDRLPKHGVLVNSRLLQRFLETESEN